MAIAILLPGEISFVRFALLLFVARPEPTTTGSGSVIFSNLADLLDHIKLGTQPLADSSKSQLGPAAVEGTTAASRDTNEVVELTREMVEEQQNAHKEQDDDESSGEEAGQEASDIGALGRNQHDHVARFCRARRGVRRAGERLGYEGG